MGHRGWWWLALVSSACGAGGGRAGAGGGGAGTGGAGGGGASVPGGTGGGWTSPEPNFHNGSRLVARTFSFPGTAPLIAGIYDRQERVECEFRAATDGKLRCLPANSVGPADPATVEPSERWQEGVEIAPATTGRVGRNEIHSTDGGQFANWISGELRDTQFGQPCRPDTTRPMDGTGDGLCLPSFAAVGGFFSDAACGQPLASVDGNWTPFVVFSPKRQLFALGEVYTGPAFISFAMGASCMAFPAGSGTRFFAIGNPLPSGTIASVQMIPRGNGRLGVQMIESEGQSVAPVRYRDLSLPYGSAEGPYFDRDLGVLCRPTWTAAGDVRCVPADSDFVPASWLTNFADSACTQPVVLNKKATAVVLRSDAALARQVIVEVRRIGAAPSATGYTMMGSACHEYLKGAGYPLGDVVPLESFARLDVTTGAEPAP
jgi:hypothetical protein